MGQGQGQLFDLYKFWVLRIAAIIEEARREKVAVDMIVARIEAMIEETSYLGQRNSWQSRAPERKLRRRLAR